MGYHLASVELAPSLRGSIDTLDIHPLWMFQQFHEFKSPHANMAYRTSVIGLPIPDPPVLIPTAFHAHGDPGVVGNPTIGGTRAQPDRARLRSRLRLNRGPHGDAEHQPHCPQQTEASQRRSKNSNKRDYHPVNFPVSRRDDVILNARHPDNPQDDAGPGVPVSAGPQDALAAAGTATMSPPTPVFL